MFHMSLGSKELFHSNFLHWISTINWDLFLNILHKIAGINNFWWEDEFHPSNNNIEVRREFHHFDLSIYILDPVKEVNDLSADSSTDNEEYSYKAGKRVVQKWIPVLILENKMKSLPYRGQLEEYTNKAFNEWRTGSIIKKAINDLKNNTATFSDWIANYGITFILLSLMDTCIGQEDCKDFEISQELKYKKNSKTLDFPFIWRHVTYRDLLAVLKEIDPSSLSGKDLNQLVIQDYSDFLDSLCSLAYSCWGINPKESFRLQISPWVKESGNGNMRPKGFEEKIKEIEEYKRLRIHDIHEKLLYDQLLVLLENKLVGCCARFDSKKNKDRFSDGIRVFTKSDYAHGVGIFEAQFFLFEREGLKEGYLKLIIQVQGERYCHMVICDKVAKGAKRVNKDMIDNLGKNLTNVWLPPCKLKSINDSLSNFISIGGSKPLFPLNTLENEELRWGKYGDNNIYQYTDIPDNTTIEQVIDAIVEDINSIYKWYTK